MPQIVEGVYFIPGRDEFLPDSHTYIIGEPASEDLSIIDIGLTGKGGYKILSAEKMGIKPSWIKRIIMTHTHLDHIGCLREVKEHLPWAELWVHEAEAELLEKGDERGVYGMEEFKSMCQMQFRLKTGDFQTTVEKKLKGGETLEIGNMVWDVVHIPGHSMGGIGLYSPVHEILIPGDVVYADFAIGRFDLFGADASALKNSLYSLAELKVDTILPGHNQTVRNLQPDYIRQVVKMWEPYLQ